MPLTHRTINNFHLSGAPVTAQGAGSRVLRTNHEPWDMYHDCIGRAGSLPRKRPFAETESNRSMFRPCCACSKLGAVPFFGQRIPHITDCPRKNTALSPSPAKPCSSPVMPLQKLLSPPRNCYTRNSR